MKGWISLYRKIRTNWIWENPDYFKAWVDILFEVNHQDNKILFDGKLIEVKRGEKITSQLKLSKRWGWSRGKVRKFLELLEKDNMIELTTTTKGTTIKVVNYNVYQDNLKTKSQQNEQQKANRPDNKKPTKSQRSDTNNNGNNENNEIKTTVDGDYFTDIAKLYSKAGFRQDSYTVDFIEELLTKYGYVWTKKSFEIAIDNNADHKNYVKSILSKWEDNGGMETKRKDKKNKRPLGVSDELVFN